MRFIVHAYVEQMHCGHGENREASSQVIAHRLLEEFGDCGEKRLLDFGCGDGYLSRHLLSDVGQIVGTDSSREMVDKYNENAFNQGLSQDEMWATVCSDIGETTEDIGLFDNVVSSIVFHHIEDMVTTIRVLADKLKDWGWLAIVDLEKVGTPANQDVQLSRSSVAHQHGVDPSALAAALKTAGLKQVQYVRLFPIKLWWRDNVDDTHITRSRADGQQLYLVKRNLMLIKGQKQPI